ncbi:hypothetical protein FB451DRAFT_1287281 [Mycena latifolia]|nr:hypothetical protein FB451DRAFT_1287281 [Mycena latifolia]
MSSKTVYLISGANRGIGYTLAASLAARPNTIVFTGARDPAAQSLKELSAKHPNVHPVKLTSGDKADNEAAIAEIQKTAGQLDVIIANVGISKHDPLATAPLEHPHASPAGAPTFAYISTSAASMGRYTPLQAAAYGSSKAAANFLIKVLDAEHPTLITMAISPGWVATDMGNAGTVANGFAAAPVTVEDSVAGILSRIDGATKEKSSGRFWNFKPSFDGNPWDIETDELPW